MAKWTIIITKLQNHFSDTDRERETERDRDRHRDRQTDITTQRQRQRQRQTEMHRESCSPQDPTLCNCNSPDTLCINTELIGYLM